MKAEAVDISEATHSVEAIAKVGGVLGAVGAFAWGVGRWFWPEWQTYAKNRLLLDSFRKNFGDQAADKILNLLRQHSHDQNHNQMRFTLVETQLSIGLYTCNHVTGECVTANKVLSEMWGLDPKDMLGFGWIQCVKDKKKALETWKFSWEKCLPYRDIYTVVNARTGEEFQVETEAYLMDESGSFKTYAGWVKRIKKAK